MISIVIGTAREGRMSDKVAYAIEASLKEKGTDVSTVDIRDHWSSAVTLPPWGDSGADTKSTKWKDIVQETDSFVFVLPEYNHSFPGEWKLLMDSLFKEYSGKRAYVAAVSGGSFAGTRIMEHVMAVLVNFDFIIAPERLHVGNVGEIFNESGSITDDKFNERVKKFVDVIAKSVQ